MKYTVYDLHQCSKGERIQVFLRGNAANVRLLDNSNYNNYKNGRKHTYYGGLVRKSPVIFTIPRNGHWYITIDLAGLMGLVSTSIKRLPSPLPEYHNSALSSIPSLIRRETMPMDDSGNSQPEYDVFISHASEDKDEVVRPLALALIKKGLKVWYDEFELKIGDSLRRKIDKGLAKSKFGIVVLSKVFIKKGWTNYELDGIITKANTGEQVLLPIWHNITKNEVIDFSPSIADKVARNTALSTIEEMADEISDLIKGE